MSNTLKMCLWRIMQTPLTFLVEGFHIWHNDVLLCVDDNEGFRLSNVHVKYT